MRYAIKHEIELHDRLIKQANLQLTGSAFLNINKAQQALDGAYEAAIEGNSERSYTLAVIGAHLFNHHRPLA